LKRIVSLVCAAASLAAWSARAGAAIEHDWKVYANVRFGYQICYPADLLTPEPEADDGDGRVFTAPSGASLRVWGVNNAASQTLDVYTSKLAEPDAKITYRTVKTGLSVISGHKGNDIFYAETLPTKDVDDAFRSFELTYSDSEASLFTDIAEKLSACFTAPP
jgi:hypothetical protein